MDVMLNISFISLSWMFLVPLKQLKKANSFNDVLYIA